VKVTNFLTTTLFTISLSPLGHAFQDLAFPKVPEPTITPGSLCEDPDQHRYPERIPYCNRDVSSNQKWAIIDQYDEDFGYQIRRTGRDNFKIDHFIPLCMGGSNENENLWPQHRSVYEQTDPWEQSLCVDLSNGDITQQQAIDTIYRIKLGVQ